jgi:spore photoproduct lyase
MKRHLPKGLTIANNVEEILTEINNHALFDTIEKPNQTDSKFITYDISCNEDFAGHRKYHDWKKIFTFFKDHPVAKATFATKIIPYEFLGFNPQEKVRIRFSLMPERLREILEPNTESIDVRLSYINAFKAAGYDVHLNFSPVVITNSFENDYTHLFNAVNIHVDDAIKDNVKAEVIFLTHNKKKHDYNIEHNLPGEDLIWRPDLQEKKISQYGADNLRYNVGYKTFMINKFREIHNCIIPWNTIRYIF